MNKMFSRNLLKLHKLPIKKRYFSCPIELDYNEPEAVMGCTQNGIRVVTEQRQSPLACVSLFIHTGPRYESPPSYNGINHFIEHMAYKGSTVMTRCAIEDFAYTSGSRLDARTTQEFQRFTITCTPQWIENAVLILCGIINQLEMNPCDVASEKDNICLEMQDGDRNYKTVIFENLIQAAFQGTPLGQRVIGPSHNIKRFDGCMAQTYMCAQFQPSRLIFATSGPVQNGYIQGIVSKMLECVPQAYSEMEPDPRACRFTSSSVMYRDDSKDFVHIAVAFEAPGFLSDDYMSMRILKNIIGSWSKSSSAFGTWPELAMRCTDTQLCDRFESFYITFGDVGLFGVYVVCDTMDAEDFLYNWQDVLKSMCCTLRQSDVDRAKRATRLELFKEREGVVKSCLSLGKEILYRNMRPSLRDYTHALDILDALELQDCAYNTLYNAQPVISAAGPTEGIPDYSRLAASQYWLRW